MQNKEGKTPQKDIKRNKFSNPKLKENHKLKRANWILAWTLSDKLYQEHPIRSELKIEFAGNVNQYSPAEFHEKMTNLEKTYIN